ncbi:hypothetical protein I4U23_013717 [Adineta vaga]|nr:hypothetical protein I4U23_013717 [Adineta vaga]
MDKVIIETSLLDSLFTCLLCNKLLHSPTVINECFHRFCKLCIVNYFEQSKQKKCPICQMIIINPLQSLKSDLTFQRLLYKIFQRKIACKSSLLTINKSTDIHIDTKIYVNLDYWDISSDVFSHDSSKILSKCYLECLAHTPLSSIEKFLRIKYSLSTLLKIDLFYQSFPLNIDDERLIDICSCFDIFDKVKLISSLDIRYVISPYGYQTILKHIHQSKQPVPLEIEVLPPTITSSLSSNSSSMDSTLKVKICRSQSSTNDWYIPQSSTSFVQLPDLVNSCQNQTKPKKLALKKKPPSLNKPRRRIRFIPTMVKVPPSIFDRLSNFHQYEFDISTYSTEKSICKVSPYIHECSSTMESLSSLVENDPLDLSLKQMSM